MAEITHEIIEHYGIYEEYSGGWKGEVNLVSWNGKEPKLDIRNWNKDHTKSSKIGTLSIEAARMLGEILIRI